MPHPLFILYLHLLGRPPLDTIALGIVRLAHALTAAAHPPALIKAAEALRSSAVLFARVCPGVTTADLVAAVPVDTSTLPMIPPGLGTTALDGLLELADKHPDRVQVSTPQERWEALLDAAAVVARLVEILEADPGHRATDPAPAPTPSGEVPLG